MKNKINQTIIRPRSGWQSINWMELYDYKDLFYFLIRRNIVALYKQTVLGFTWAIIRPVFSMIIFSIVFGRLAKMPTDGIPYPLFSYAALIPWTYFSTSLAKSTSSLISQKNIFTKVYFPRLVIPLTPVFSTLVDFFISFIIYVGLMFWYNMIPSINILLLPILILLMMLTSAGLGMWLSAMAIQYRDIPHGISFLVQLLMYIAPVVFPVSLITDKFGETFTLFYSLYPLVGVIEGFRSCLIGVNPFPWDLIGMGSISAIALFISGAFYFQKKERIFSDVA